MFFVVVVVSVRVFKNMGRFVVYTSAGYKEYFFFCLYIICVFDGNVSLDLLQFTLNFNNFSFLMLAQKKE